MEPAFALTLPGGLEMTFQSIPPGPFRMGSRRYYDDEEPPHRVHITRDFYLATYPVTQAQFAAWRPEHENHFSDRPNHPGENMEWHEASQYCRWLTESCAASIPNGYVAVLPSEAQ